MIKKSTFILFLILLYTVQSCDKEDFKFDLPKVIKLPALRTYDISNINSNSASCSSEITFDGGASVTTSGVCYGTANNPTLSNKKVISNPAGGAFYSIINELSPNTTYYLRAFATNSSGTGYGNEMVFKTLSTIATITTTPITNITAFSSMSGGNVLSDGGANIRVRGVCYAKTSNPTTSNNYVLSGTGVGSFTANLINLYPNTTYYVRAFAQNEIGIAYGSQYSFTTSSALPIISTSSVTNITASSAVSGGNISSDGGSTVNNKGVCYATTSNPTISNNYVLSGTGTGAFTSNLTGLLPNTTYYVRAFAINAYGIAYGSQYSFTTSYALPTITTSSVTNITGSSAISGGNISSDGGSTVINRGVCYAKTSNPTTSNNYVLSGTGIGSFTTNLINLSPNTTYYLRAFAQNEIGMAYGSQYSFTTSGGSAVVTTSELGNVNSTTIYAVGNISSDGGSNITNRGFCYATTTNPTTSSSTVSLNSGTGYFESYIDGLSPSTTYYVRAYATNAYGTFYGSQISITTLAQTLAVGQSYQGGIIAYIFQSGDAGYIAGQTHGLIAATSNQSSGAQWGCSGTSINTTWNFGTGQNNTTLIVNGCSTSNTAARICNDLVSGGYSDWYLPSYHELLKLYSNKTSVSGFSNSYYWSSSQYSATQGICVYFSNGSGYANSKISNMYVRAIRKF